MRFVFKLLLVSVGTVVVLLIASLGWLYLDSRDLPDIETLTRFSPQAAIEVSDACLAGNFLAIPYDSIGHNLHAALNAAEVSENDPGALTTIYREFKGDQRLHRATLSTQISRTMFARLPNKRDAICKKSELRFG
jgi:hypothetical protein